MASVNKTVINYLKENPSVNDNLSIINFSKLSRKIIEETNLEESNFDAVLIAIRRLSYKQEKISKQDVKNLLKESSVDIKNKILVCIAEKDVLSLAELQKNIRRKSGFIHVVESNSSITIITSENFEEQINKHMKNKIIKLSKNLVEIVIKSPPQLEDVPGFTGYIYSLFGASKINILETLSCWEDTIIVINNNDLSKAMEVLKI